MNSPKKTLKLQSLTSKQRYCLYQLCEERGIKVEKTQEWLYPCTLAIYEHDERCNCKGTRYVTKNGTANVCSQCKGYGYSKYDTTCGRCLGSGDSRGAYRNGVTLQKV